MERFDLVIIGSGSGNSLVTPDFDDKRVAIVESGVFGGTCLNVGCIPTKMFVYSADVALNVRGASRYGVDARIEKVRWPDIRDRIFARIDPISSAGRDYRVKGANTTTFLGRARFVGERELVVTMPDGGTEHVRGDQIVVAAGGHPVIPDVIAASGVPYHTSDTIMRLDTIPRRLVIVGGGYIACEFAHVFGSLGTEVTLVVRGDRLLRHLDGDISRRFTGLAADSWDLRLGVRVRGVEQHDDILDISLDDGGDLRADEILVATGRAPNTVGLGAELAGIALRDDGRVVVDRYGRSTAPGVWALGDVSSPYQLKHVANHEARVVAHNIAHPDAMRPFNHRAVPAAVFSHPQVATVGETEEELNDRGARYVVKIQDYGDTAYGWAMEDTSGICKVLADPDTGQLLGVHVLGPQASSIIQPAIQAMAFGQRADEVARDQYWIHPALPEVLENALLGLELG